MTNEEKITLQIYRCVLEDKERWDQLERDYGEQSRMLASMVKERRSRKFQWDRFRFTIKEGGSDD